MRLFRVLPFVFGPIGIIAACSSFDEEEPTSPGQEAGVEAANRDDAAKDAGGDATVEDAPTDAGPIRAYRYVFVTSGTRNGLLSDTPDASLLEADKFCSNEALSNPQLAGLKWKAWLATIDINARDRIADAGVLTREYRLVDDKTIVFRAGYSYPAAGAVLPVSAIALNQNGADASAMEVWTGTANDGRTHSSANICESWTTLAGSGITGYTTHPTMPPPYLAEWTSASNGAVQRTCSFMNHFYCFEVDP